MQVVTRDPLNFFSPFERLPPNHENQLTRALLVVLRLSPAAHEAWLALVAPGRQLQQLPTASFETQRRAVRTVDPETEPAELISVFLAPEEPLSGGGIVTESDRGQVLDAIVDYGGELLVVVENKVAEAEATQALNLNVTGARVSIGDGHEAAVVLWRDLLDQLIALRERGLAVGTEDAVLDDFLTYVEDHFAALGPFRTLRLCHGNAFRQRRRLRQVLAEATAADASINVYGPHIVATAGDVIGSDAYLTVSDGAVELSFYAADTLTQARAFYTSPSTIEGLRALCSEPGWRAVPNFHFGHFERGYCWTCNRTDLDRYIDIWVSRIADEGAVGRSDWPVYWAWLEEERIACAEDWPEFKRHFVSTNRQKALPRPGLWLSRRWAMSDAEELDGSGEFARQVREALDHALAALGVAGLAPPHPDSSVMG